MPLQDMHRFRLQTMATKGMAVKVVRVMVAVVMVMVMMMMKMVRKMLMTRVRKRVARPSPLSGIETQTPGQPAQRKRG